MTVRTVDTLAVATLVVLALVVLLARRRDSHVGWLAAVVLPVYAETFLAAYGVWLWLRIRGVGAAPVSDLPAWVTALWAMASATVLPVLALALVTWIVLLRHADRSSGMRVISAAGAAGAIVLKVPFTCYVCLTGLTFWYGPAVPTALSFVLSFAGVVLGGGGALWYVSLKRWVFAEDRGGHTSSRETPGNPSSRSGPNADDGV